MKEKMFKITLITGLLMITVGLIIDNINPVTNFIEAKQMNLSVNEVDIDYESSNGEDVLVQIENEKKSENSIKKISYVDTSWDWPTDNDYYITTVYSAGHPAIDIVPRGTLNAYAAQSGTIITNSYKYDNGNYLVLKLDEGHYLMYAHLSEKLVQEGEHVEKGQIIGIIGRTGYATGVHLHYAVWTGYPHQSTPLNPFSFY